MALGDDTGFRILPVIDDHRDRYHRWRRHPAWRLVALVFAAGLSIAAALLVADAFTDRVVTDGVVTDIRDMGRYDLPVIDFALPDGEAIRFCERVWVIWDRWSVGQSVRVAYDPAAPQDARVHSVPRLLALPGLFGVFGVLLLTGLAVGRRQRRRLQAVGSRAAGSSGSAP